MMRRRRYILDKPKINMTPMIDVVFLLLTFFVMTLKIIVPEGDFHVQMLPEGQAKPVDVSEESIQVHLFADAAGELSSIQINDETVGNFDQLQQHVSAAAISNPQLEVVLFLDDTLHYEHVIYAMTAINGEIHEGQVRKICDNIKFARHQ